MQALREAAARLDLELVPWDGIEWDTIGDDAAAEALDDFYLLTLRRPLDGAPDA